RPPPSPCIQGEGRGEGNLRVIEHTLSPTLSLNTGRGADDYFRAVAGPLKCLYPRRSNLPGGAVQESCRDSCSIWRVSTHRRIAASIPLILRSDTSSSLYDVTISLDGTSCTGPDSLAPFTTSVCARAISSVAMGASGSPRTRLANAGATNFDT